MKKMTSYLNLLAVSLVLFAGVNSAHAILKAVSPNLDPTTGGGGHPTWYQDQNSVAVKPFFGLPPAGSVFPVGFPPEWFYYLANSDTFPLGTTGETAFVIMAIEAAYADGNPASPTFGALVNPDNPNAKAIVFQRLRVRITPPTATGLFIPGEYTLNHPWGTTVFNCTNPQNNKDCQDTRDLPVIGIFNFAGALGGPAGPLDTTMTTFPRSTVPPLDPTLLGDGLTLATIDAGAGSLRNSVSITGPPGTGSTTLFTVVAKKIGLDVTPLGVTDFGVVKRAPGSVTKTFNISNLTGAIVPLTFTSPSPDFTTLGTSTVAPSCGATLAIDANCNFDVTFSPTGTIDGAKAATISIAGGAGVPTALLMVTGTADGTAPALTLPTTGFTKFSKTPTQTISGTVTDVNGVAGVTVTIDGVTTTPAIVDAAAGTWSFAVPALTETNPVTAHTIVVTATDKALSTAVASPGGNVATVNDLNNTITVDSIPPAVAITAPADGLFTINTTPALTFTATDLNNPLPIVTVDGGTPITPSPATLGPLTDGQHSVVVATTDSAGNLTTHTNTFTVDTIAPVITVTSPLVTATATIGVTSPVLTFPITETNLDPAKTVVMLDGVLVPNPVSGSTILGPFVPGVPHILTIAAADLAGTPAPGKTVTFTLLLSDGSINSLGATAPTIADVITALKVALTGFSEVSAITVGTDAFKHGDVAPLVNGVPAPDGKIEIGDALTILKKVVGITTF